MAICGGDVLQYQALKRGSVDDYCIKLKSYVDAVAPKDNLKEFFAGATKK